MRIFLKGLYKLKYVKNQDFWQHLHVDILEQHIPNILLQEQNLLGTCPYHSSLKVCTETGLVANERCPNVRYIYGRGEYVGNSSLWKTNSYYYKPTNVPLKTCTLH